VGWPRALLLACLIASALASTASATHTTTVSVDRIAPALGEPVTFTAEPPPSDGYRYHFDANQDETAECPEGVSVAGATGDCGPTYTYTYTSIGRHEMDVYVMGVDDHFDMERVLVEVVAPLTGALQVDPESPAPHQPVQLTAAPSGGKPGYGYAWDLDGDGAYDDASGSGTASYTWSLPGSYDVGVRISDSASPAHRADVRRTVVVRDVPLEPRLAVSPPEPGLNQPVTFDASATTGVSPFSFGWDLDGNGTFERSTGTAPVATQAYARETLIDVGVQVTDALGRVQVARARLDVQERCLKKVAFALIEATTRGCFRKATGEDGTQYETTDALKLNGIPFPAPSGGRKAILKPPIPAVPGGRFSISKVTVKLGGFTAFDDDINWRLPAGGRGDEAQVARLAVPGGQRLFGLAVGGSIALKLGVDENGKHYATFPLNIELPDIFRTGPDRSAGGASGTAAIRTDDDGVHYDGLRLLVKNVWIGKLQVEQVCFSYVPAGSSKAVETCPVPSLDGRPYITCNESVNTDRWDGNAVLILPTKAKTRLAMFGGVANRRLSKLGGFVDNLGTTLPITESVYLNRIGIGLCVYPPPFKLRGDVGVSVWPLPSGTETLAVNGYFLYTDAFQSSPWSLELGGSVEVYDKLIGSGRLVLRPNGSLDFGVASGFDVAGIVSVAGSIDGWLEATRTPRFNIDGRIRSCIRTLCAGADTVLSSTGLAACLDAGRITYWVLVKDHNWSRWKWWRVHWEARYIDLKAGFGHRWRSGRVDLFGGSCYLAGYRATRTLATAAQAGTELTFDVKRGTPALAVRVKGQGGPPKIVVTGPDGRRIESPATEPAAAEDGRFMLAENPTDDSTSVLLVNPGAGRWTVAARAGSALTALEQGAFEPPGTAIGNVRAARGGRRVLTMAYAVPPGATMTVVERGDGVQRTIAAGVRGRSCPADREAPGRDGRLCATVRFTPALGPSGRRTIEGIVTRDGIPLETIEIARYRAPAPRRPSRPGSLRMVRKQNTVQVAWSRSRGAASYAVGVAMTDGRRLSFVLGRRCRGLQIAGVQRAIGVSIRVTGLREDIESGPAARARLRPGRARAGAKGAVPKRLCRG